MKKEEEEKRKIRPLASRTQIRRHKWNKKEKENETVGHIMEIL